MQGWRVLERLKADLATRHIPVCVVSTDDARDRALNSGALGFIAKPLTSRDLVDQAIEQLRDFVSRPARQVLFMTPEAATPPPTAPPLRPPAIPTLASF